MPCFSKDKDKLGLAHIASIGSSVTVEVLKFFGSVNITVPNVGCTQAFVDLNSTSIYPTFVRLHVSNANIYSQYSTFLGALGWDSVAIIYENDSYGLSAYYYMIQVFDNQKIANAEELRIMPRNLDREGVKANINVIKAAIESKARLIILLMLNPMNSYVIEAFYDLGMRRGDVMFATSHPSFLTDIEGSDEFKFKRLELAVPAFILEGEKWVDQIGLNAKNRLLEQYKVAPNAFACNYYDGVFLISNALD